MSWPRSVVLVALFATAIGCGESADQSTASAAVPTSHGDSFFSVTIGQKSFRTTSDDASKFEMAGVSERMSLHLNNLEDTPANNASPFRNVLINLDASPASDVSAPADNDSEADQAEPATAQSPDAEAPVSASPDRFRFPLAQRPAPGGATLEFSMRNPPRAFTATAGILTVEEMDIPGDHIHASFTGTFNLTRPDQETPSQTELSGQFAVSGID